MTQVAALDEVEDVFRDVFATVADAFQGPGRKPALQEDELTRLKRENARLQEENDILKKAAAYFARELK